MPTLDAPRYSFSRMKTGPARHTRGAARLSLRDVQDIRRYAAREGYGQSIAAQTRAMQRYYPLAAPTMRDILRNHSWYDPSFTPGQPDAAFWSTTSLAQLVLLQVMKIGATA